MPIKARIDKHTETFIFPFPIILIVSIVFFSLLVFAVIFLPYYSISYLYLSGFLSVVGFFSSLWLNQKPNLWAKFFKYSSFSALFTLITIRMVGYLLPTLSVIASSLIVLSSLYVNLLPIFDLSKTKLIKRELYYPQTRLGKTLQRFAMVLLPIGGVIGASIGLLTSKFDNTKSITLAIVLSPLCWFLALIMPFSSKAPMSPWEDKRLKAQSISAEVD